MPTFNEAKVKYLAKVFLNGSFLQSRLGSIPCEGRKILLYKRKNKTSILRASKSQSPLGLIPCQGGSISTLNAILIRAYVESKNGWRKPRKDETGTLFIGSAEYTSPLRSPSHTIAQ